MKIVFSSNLELIHAYANERQNVGRAGNMSFSGGVLFSYNTAIAHHVTNAQGENAVILNATSYSNSTSKQQGRLFNSIPNYKKRLYIRNIGYNKQSLKFSTDYDFKHLIESYEYDASQLLIKASKARTKKESYQAEAFNLLNELKQYADFFGLVYEFESNIESLQAAAIARAEAEKAEAEKRKAERIKQQAENLEKWRLGENVSAFFEITALRLNGENIQTSRGANIPVTHAIKVWPLLKRLHDSGGEYMRGDSAIHLGHYTLDKFSADNLHVGCHVIPFAEVQGIANQLNLK